MGVVFVPLYVVERYGGSYLGKDIIFLARAVYVL